NASDADAEPDAASPQTTRRSATTGQWSDASPASVTTRQPSTTSARTRIWSIGQGPHDARRGSPTGTPAIVNASLSPAASGATSGASTGALKSPVSTAGPVRS